MFDFLKSKTVDVVEHWYAPVDSFNISTQEYYAAVEAELKRREVPDLAVSRVEFREGNLVSAKRQYLRLTRDRLIFDICAAPFGTGYFFSCRMAEEPRPVSPIAIAILAIFILIMLWVSTKMFGVISGFFGAIVLLIFAVWFVRNLAIFGLYQIDERLHNDPIFGPIYDSFFRRETYYRIDTRLMYQHTVSSVVKQLIEEVTAAKGIKLMKQYRRVPPSGELYHESSVPLTGTPSPETPHGVN